MTSFWVSDHNIRNQNNFKISHKQSTVSARLPIFVQIGAILQPPPQKKNKNKNYLFLATLEPRNRVVFRTLRKLLKCRTVSDIMNSNYYICGSSHFENAICQQRQQSRRRQIHAHRDFAITGLIMIRTRGITLQLHKIESAKALTSSHTI